MNVPYKGADKLRYFRGVIGNAMWDCEKTLINPFAKSMAKTGHIRTAWKNRALEELEKSGYNVKRNPKGQQ